MKVKKFNESFSMEVDDDFKMMRKSSKLTNVVNDYIIDFNENTDSGIINWISEMAGKNVTKLSEYKNLYTEQKLIDFGSDKNLKSLIQYGEVNLECSDIINEIESLKRKIKKYVNKKQKTFTEASSQLMYKFQEDLFLKDFNGLYNLFIIYSVEDQLDTLSDIHPDIVTKYGDKIIEIVKPIISSKKFNI